MNIVYGCNVLMDTVVAVCDPKHNRFSGPAEQFQIWWGPTLIGPNE